VNLDDARLEAEEELRRFGLDEHGWTFAFDNAARRFGSCRYQERKITLSKRLTLANEPREVRETILHEIAHAIAGHAAGHGPEFVRAARAIGCTGSRCYGEEVVRVPKQTLVRIADLFGPPAVSDGKEG